MHLHDTVRNSRKMTKDDENNIRDQIMATLEAIWTSKGQSVLGKRAFQLKVERLISDVQNLLRNPGLKRGKTEFIEEQQKKYDLILDIGENASAPVTPLKRKSDQMVSFD